MKNRVVPVVLGLFAYASPYLRGGEPDGKAIYMTACARCHGKVGEGAKAYPHPLVGNRSLEQLAKYVGKTMPENDPGSLSDAETKRVSSFIYDAFYSSAAQAKIKPPRTDLARLTVNEYRGAVADLVGPIGARPGKAKKDEFGLRGEYFNSEKRRRSLAFARVDPSVQFDFGKTDQPDFDKLKTEELAAMWQGSVVALDTGLYDFAIRTEHSARMWVNDAKKPLIDAWVKSGSETEFRGSIYLLAGRAYPIKLEMQRGSVGVQKDKKEKSPPPKTTIGLLWKPPGRSLDVIPPYNLRPSDSPKTFALSIALPPDDRSAGYERGANVSKAWVQATTDGAIETATYVSENLGDLSGVKNDDPKRREKLKDYAARFVERAFRRPLTPEQRKLYIDRQFELAKDDDTAIKRVVLMTLQSPRFLYREPATGGDAFDVASRLSFELWDSLPDRELLDAAVSGKLRTREDVIRETNRMLGDPRAKAKLRGFMRSWLKIDQIAELTKDKSEFPEFNAEVVSDLQTSLELFLDEAIWSEKPDFRRLFLADHLYLNGRLSKIYGGDLPADAPFQKVTLKPGERAGVLTHPFLMSALSYPATTSPIHRGVFLARNMLGVTLRQPPDAFTPLPAELHPNLNTRERIALQTKPRECQSCHQVINPLGFTLENFDAIGRFRDREKGKPIDATGEFVDRSAETIAIRGQNEMARFLAKSDEAHEAFVARLFHHLVRQPALAYGPETLTELRRFFETNEYDIRRLIVEIAARTALSRTTSAGKS